MWVNLCILCAFPALTFTWGYYQCQGAVVSHKCKLQTASCNCPAKSPAPHLSRPLNPPSLWFLAFFRQLFLGRTFNTFFPAAAVSRISSRVFSLSISADEVFFSGLAFNFSLSHEVVWQRDIYFSYKYSITRQSREVNVHPREIEKADIKCLTHSCCTSCHG